MANGNDIRFGVGFDIDQSSLNKIKSALTEIQNLQTKDLVKIDSSQAESELAKIKESASELQGALQRSFNTDLGTLNVSKFNEELKKLKLSDIQQNLAKAGTVGQTAFKNIATQALTTNMQLKQTNQFLDKMGVTMMNTVKWSISSSIMNSFTSSVQNAFNYVKSLDTSLNNMRVVTGQSSEEMARFAIEANNAAQALGRQTREYTNAALTYAQQGLNAEEIRSRTETTLKAANITGESTGQMAEYLTAVWNGFQVAIDQQVGVVDKLAAVADSSASNMAELATGMSRVAAAANSMGVDVDQLNAQMATIISVTRAAPESVGNALKTIYSRIADIEAGADESGVTLGNYSGKMAELGFSVLDASGNLRDMGEVMEEIGNSWGYLTREQQTYLAQTMAGQRQYNHLITLFDNWDKYTQNLNTSLQAQGTLEQKNSVYMESLTSHMKQMKAAQEGLISSLADSDSFKGLIDAATIALNLMTKFADAIGGGGTALIGLGSLATTVFGKQIGSEIAGIIQNFKNACDNAAQLTAQMEVLAQFQKADIQDPNVQTLINMKQQIIDLSKVATAEEQNTANELIREVSTLQDQKAEWEAKVSAAEKYYNKIAESNATIPIDSISDFDPMNIGENALEKQQQFIKNQKADLMEFEKSIKSAKKALFELAEVEQKEATNSDKSKKANDEFSKSLDKVRDSVADIHEQFDGLAQVELVSDLQLKRMKDAFDQYQDAFDSQDNEKMIAAARRISSVFSDVLDESEADFNNYSQVIRQSLDGIGKTYEEAISQGQANFNTLIKQVNTRALVTGVVELAGALGSLATVLQTIKQIETIWSDDTISKGEKITQILTNIGFVLPQIVNIIKVVKTELPQVASQLGKILTALVSSNPWILAIAAAIGAVVAVGYKWYQQVVQFDKAVEKANKELKEQQQIASKIRQEYLSLSSSVQALISKQDNLKNLIKGTQEWKDAVSEVNTQIRELIDQFPELSQYLSNVNGELQLSEDGLEQLLDRQAEVVESQNDQAIYAQQELLSAQTEQVIQQLADELGITHEAAKDLVTQLEKNGYDVQDLSKTIEKDSPTLANTIRDHESQILSSINSINSNTNAIENLNSTLSKYDFSNSEGVQEANKKGYGGALTKILEAQVDEISDELLKKMQEAFSEAEFKVPISEQQANEYASLFGYQQYKDSQWSSLGPNQGQSYIFYRDQNDKEGVELSLEDIQKQVAGLKARRQVSEESLEAEKQLQQVISKNNLPIKDIDRISDIVKDGRSDLNDLNKIELQELKSKILENKELFSEIFKVDTNELSKNIDQVFGLANVQRLQYTDEQQVAPTAGESGTSHFNPEVATGNQLKSISIFRDALSTEDLQAFDTMLSKVGEDAGKLGAAFASFNWGTGGIADLNQLLQDQGLAYSVLTPAVQEYLQQTGWGDLVIEGYATQVDSLTELISKLESSSKLSKDEQEELQQQMMFLSSAMGDVAAVSPELTEALANITTPGLEGTAQYIESIQTLRDYLADVHYDLKLERADEQIVDFQESVSVLKDKWIEAKNEIENGDIAAEVFLNDEEALADLQTLGDRLKSMERVQLEIELSENARIINDLERLQQQCNNVQEAAELIGKGFVVAGSDLDALNDAFPGILANIQALDDGMWQLDATVANAIVSDIQAASADALQAATDEVTAQANVLLSYEKKYRAIAEAARVAAGEETDSEMTKDEAIEILFDALQTDMRTESKTTSETILKHGNEMEGGLATTDEQIAQNAAGAFNNMTVTFNDAVNNILGQARQLATKIKAALEGEDPGGDIGGAGGIASDYVAAFKGTADQVVSDIEEAQHTVEDVEAAAGQSLEEIAANAEAAADSFHKAYEDLIADAGQATSAVDKLNNSLDRAKTGQGPKEKGGKGKSGKTKKEKEKKEKDPKKIDPFDDDDLDSIESKFHDIDLEIQKLTKDLEKLQKLQNRYLGSALVHNLNQQLGILKKQKAAYKEKLSIAKEELEAQKKKLEAQGVEIGKDGNIKNYTDALKNKQEELNALVDKYNGSTAEAQENLKGQVDAQKKNYDALKKQMGAYEQLNGQTIPEIEAQIAAIEEMIIELQIEKFNAVIELHIDWQNFHEGYMELKQKLQEYHSQFASMDFNTRTGEVTANSSREAAATIMASTQRQADQSAVKQSRDAEDKYKTDRKKLKTKKGREELAEEYGVSLTTKAERKNFEKWLADNYEQTLDNINQTKSEIYDKAEQQFYDEMSGKKHSAAEQEGLQQDLDYINRKANEDRETAERLYNEGLKRIGHYSTGTDIEQDTGRIIEGGDTGEIVDIKEEYNPFQELLDVDLSEPRKKLKQDLTDAYQDALNTIEDHRNQAIQETVDAYSQAGETAEEAENHRLHDFGEKYRSQIKLIKEQLDQIINGDILSSGGRGKSILDEAIEHTDEITDRINRMNANTKFDKEGNRIMGTDKLKVGDVDPLTGEKITSKKQLKKVKKAIGKDKSGEVYADMQAKIIEDGKKYAEYLEQSIEKIQELAQQARQAWLDAIDERNDLVNDILDDYDYMDDLYDHQMKLLELTGKKDSQQYKDAQAARKKSRDEEAKYIIQRRDVLREEMKSLDVMSEEYKKYYDELKQLGQNYYDIRLQQIEELQDAMRGAMDDLITEYDKKVTKGLGIDEFAQHWEDMKDKSDLFLDNVDKAYAVQALRAKYTEVINDTTDLKTQERLREIMEQQTSYLQDQEYLSQAQVDHANDLYDVTLKQIALEEARQNKSKMRLRRDSQGNYTYQFVADSDNVQKKEQEVIDALKKMNDDAEKAIQANLDAQVEAYKDYIQRLRKINEEYSDVVGLKLSDENLSEEQRQRVAERDERLDYIQQNFSEFAEILSAQNEGLSAQFEESQALLMTGMAEINGIEQTLEDMGIKNQEQAAQMQTFLEQMMSAEGSSGSILGLLGNKNLQDVIDQADLNAGDIRESIGNYEQYITSDTASVFSDTRDEAKAGNDLVEKLKDQVLPKELKEQRQTMNEIEGEIQGELEKDAEQTQQHIEDTKVQVEEMDDAIADLKDDLWEIELQSEMAIAALKESVDAIYAALREIMNEGEYGSEVGDGETHKGAKATFGKNISNDQDTKNQILQEYVAEQTKKSNEANTDWEAKSKKSLIGKTIDGTEVTEENAGFVMNSYLNIAKDRDTVAWTNYREGSAVWKRFYLTALAQGKSVDEAIEAAERNYKTLITDQAQAKYDQDERITSGYIQDKISASDIYKQNSDKNKSVSQDVLDYVNSAPGLLQFNKEDKMDNKGRVQVYTMMNGKKVTLGYVDKTHLIGYASGGYTGDWSGNDGKLAMLHKKEMVLNQEDTANVINAAALANNVADTLKAIHLNTDLNSAAAAAIPRSTGDSIDQTVTIKAEFPNVKSQDDIERALKNLVNVAAQKASPNRRVM